MPDFPFPTATTATPYTPYSSITEEQKEQLLLSKGLSPEEYYFDPLTLSAYKKQPKIENSDPVSQDETVTGEVKKASKEVSRSEAVGAALKTSILPSIGGAGLAAAGMRLGALGGPIGMSIGGLLGAVGGGFGTSYLQNKLGVISPETEATLAAGREQYPVMTTLAEMAPNALFFNPLKAAAQLPTLGGAIAKVARGALLGPAERAALINAGVNVGINTGLEGGSELATEGKIDPLRLALTGVGGGLLFNEPTALGKKMGFHSTDANAYPKAQEGQKTTIKGYLPEPQRLLEEGTPPPAPEPLQLTAPPEPKLLPPATDAGPAPKETPRLDTGKFGNESMKRAEDYLKAKAELEQQHIESVRLEAEAQKQLNEQRKLDLAIGNKKGYEPERPPSERLQEKIQANQIPPQDKFPKPKDTYARLSEETPPAPQQPAGHEAILAAQEKTLLEKRGQNIQVEPDLQRGGKSILGEFVPKDRKVIIGEKSATVTTRPHEGIHGYLNDLKNSPMGRDKKLYNKALEIGEGLRKTPEKLGPNDNEVIKQMEAEGASRKDIAEELFVRKAAVEDYRRLLNRPTADKGTVGEWWKDVKNNVAYKLGSNNPETIANHLSNRYNFDAPYGTRTDVMPPVAKPTTGPKTTLAAAPEAKTEESTPKQQIREEDLPPELHEVLKATPAEMHTLPKKWGVAGQTHKSDELAAKMPNTPEVHKMLDDMAAAGDKQFKDYMLGLKNKKMTEEDINNLSGLSTKGQFFREIKGKMTEGGSSPEAPKQSRLPEDIMKDMEGQIRDEGFERGKKVISTAKQVRQEHSTEGEMRDYHEANEGYKSKLNEISAFTDEDKSKQSTVAEDLSGVNPPERYSFFKIMESATDKVRQVGGKIGHEIADAVERYSRLKNNFEGKFRNLPYYDLAKLNLDDKELANIAAYRRGNFRSEGSPPELTGKEKAGNEILTKAWKELNDEKIARKLEGIAQTKAGRRFDPNFIQDMLSDEAHMLFTKKAGSPEAKAAEREWINYAVNTEGYTGGDVAKDISNYIKALAGDKSFSTKALDYGVPDSLRETDLRKVILKYGRRQAQDLAYFSELQSNPRVATALGLPKRTGGPSTAEGVESIAGNPDVANLKKFIFNDFNTLKHPRFNAIARTATNLLLGGATGIRNNIQLPSLIVPYLETTADVTSIFKAIGNISDARRKSIEYGVRSGTMDLDRWHSLENPDKITQFFNRFAEAARKYQGRDLLEQGDRILTFAIGQELAKNKVLEALNGRKQSLEWLKKFGATEEVTPANLNNIDLDQIAANFTERVQGTYDARGLAAGVFDSNAAPFMALSRWNIEKSNVLWKDVITPAKNGNFKPLLVYTLGSALTGVAIKEINELLSGKREYQPSLNEATVAKKKEFQIASVINLMQMGSYMGLMGDLLKAGSDLGIQKDLPRNPLTFPAVSFAEDFAYTLADFRSALDNHVDPIDAFIRFGWETMRQSTQNLRLLDSRVLNQEDTERANRFRDLRTFKKLEGENMPFAAGQYRRNRVSEQTPERQFKQEQDLSKAAAMLPKLIQNAITNSKGDPYKLQKEFASLKINSYQTMPNPENDPIAFSKFVQFLAETQGKEAAAKTMADYFTKGAINQAKSGMIP
jgi:hypothetical protein